MVLCLGGLLAMVKGTSAIGDVSTIETVDRLNGLRVGHYIEKADAKSSLKKDDPPTPVSGKGY
eukprot:6251028-Pyramimonas_sp.AAC.1